MVMWRNKASFCQSRRGGLPFYENGPAETLFGPIGPRWDPVGTQSGTQEIQLNHRFRDQPQKSNLIESKHIWVQTRY